MDYETLMTRIAALFEDEEEMVQGLLEVMERRYGTVPLVARVLSEKPRIFIPHAIKGMHTLRGPRALEPKVAELIAVATATALRCEHCVRTHIKGALARGATLDEILETIVIAGMIAESSSLSVALREYRKAQAQASRAPGE